jgi:hypothetical protein
MLNKFTRGLEKIVKTHVCKDWFGKKTFDLLTEKGFSINRLINYIKSTYDELKVGFDEILVNKRTNGLVISKGDYTFIEYYPGSNTIHCAPEIFDYMKDQGITAKLIKSNS